MSDADFTKRVQQLEKTVEEMNQRLRNFDAWATGMINEITDKQNRLVDALEEAGALEHKSKIVTLN